MVNEREVLDGLKRELTKAKKLLKQCGKEYDTAKNISKNKMLFLAAAEEGERKLRSNLRNLRDAAPVVSLEEWKIITAELQQRRHFVTDLKEQVKLAEQQVEFFKSVIEDNKKAVEGIKAEIKRVKKLAKGAKILRFPKKRK